VAATGRLAFTATVRVVDRVHGHAADGRALALPPHPAGLAPVDVRLLGVADLADGGAAADVDHPDLAGRHTKGGHGALLRRRRHQAGQQPSAAPHPGRYDGARHRAPARRRREVRPFRGLFGAAAGEGGLHGKLNKKIKEIDFKI